MKSTRIRNIVLLSCSILVLGLLPAVFYRIMFGGVPSLTPKAAKKMLTSRPDQTLLVDVRPAGEFEQGHLAEAVNWPLSDIMLLATTEAVPEPQKAKTLLVICQSGYSSVRAVRRLQSIGLQNVFNVRDGMNAWIADADNPDGRKFCALSLIGGKSTGLPEKQSPFIEQFALVVSSFVFKPVYVLISLALALFIWRKRTRSADLRVLGVMLVLFFLGEVFCAVNYTFYAGRSYFFDYLHSFGMVLTFGFSTYALFETLDRRLIHFSQAQESCAFLPLCRQCYKTSDMACRLFRIFFWFSLAGLAFALIPLTARPHPVSYNTFIFGTFFNFANPLPFQIFEIRFSPLAAALFFASAALVLLFHQRRPSSLTKVLFSGGAGYLGFSFLRLFLFAPYGENLVWLFFWEEATELVFMGGLIVVLWLFRKGLFPKSGPSPE